MNQKMWKTALAIVLCLALASCSNGAQDQAPAAYEPAATAQALLDSEAFSGELSEIGKDAIPAYYGLDESTVQDCVAYGSMAAGSEGFVVAVFTDEAAAKTGVEVLQAWVDLQKSAQSNYMPEEVAKLEKAIIDQRGASAVLVVPNDSSAAQAVLDGIK